jgi:S1-C subfamily serine protease
VGYDRSQDVAVIQLSGASGLKTSVLGNSSTVAVGESIVAIGNAGGVGGTPSAAGGSVVAVDQQITATDENSVGSERLSGLIEVNADVQSGDSGGPLVNSTGQVIGVDAAASAGSSFRSSGGQGYAIPINQALAIAAQIENNHFSASVHIGPTAFLGVELPSATSRATIVGVLSGSPAAKAGLGSGCVITSLAGRAVGSPTTLISLLSHCRPKDRVRLGWSDRSGQRHAATVQLAAGPAQ